jgi:hypothetical protein
MDTTMAATPIITRNIDIAWLLEPSRYKRYANYQEAQDRLGIHAHNKHGKGDDPIYFGIFYYMHNQPSVACG